MTDPTNPNLSAPSDDFAQLLFDVRCATTGQRLTQREREKINRLANWAEKQFTATPAIRDQAFEEAAAKAREVAEACGNRAMAKTALAIEGLIRALKGTPIGEGK